MKILRIPKTITGARPRALFLLWLLTSSWNCARAQGHEIGLNTAAGTLPRLALQLAHTAAITALALSPDDKLALSGSMDNSAKLWDVASGRLIRTFEHANMVGNVAFLPDGKHVLTSASNAVYLWDIMSGRLVREYFVPDEIASMSCTADGRMILAASMRGGIYIWDAAKYATKDADDPISSAQLDFNGNEPLIDATTFSADGRYLASTTNLNEITLWNTSTGKEVRHIKTQTDRADVKAFSPDGRFLVSLGENEAKQPQQEKVGRDFGDAIEDTNTVVVLWDLATGRQIWSFGVHSSLVDKVTFAEDSHFLFVSDSERSVNIIDVSAGNSVGHLSEKVPASDEPPDIDYRPPEFEALAVSRKGTYLLSGDSFGQIMVWDIQAATEIRQLSRRTFPVGPVAFSPDGNFALSVRWDGEISRWDFKTGVRSTLLSLPPRSSDVTALSYDGRFAIGSGEKEPISVWNLVTGEKIQTFDASSAGADRLVLSRDGRYVLSTPSNEFSEKGDPIQLWDIGTGSLIRTIGSELPSLDIKVVNGDEVAAIGDAITTGRPFARIILALAFSADGRYAISGSEDRSARLWDLSTGHQIRKFQDYLYWIHAVALSPSNTYAASGNSHGVVKVWSVATGKLVHILQGHTSPVNAVAFSSNGRYLLSASGGSTRVGEGDNTVRLWDVQTGKALRVFRGHVSTVTQLAFSRDDRFAISGSDDGTVRLWPIKAHRTPRRAAIKTSTPTSDPLCTLVSFVDGTWAAVDAEGRFDSNNLEDIQGLHWIMSDDPLHPLPLELFMRDYYEPGLLARIIAGESFRPVRSLVSLNRVQPDVRITRIDADPRKPDLVSVTIEVSAGKGGAQKSTEKTPSRNAVYNLRLFRDKRLVAYAPEENGDDSSGEIALDSTGKSTFVFDHIRIPHARDQKTFEFTAFAFNADRVKSATARRDYILSFPLSPARCRAYVISFGVNISANPDWNLRYAANDARLVQSVLVTKLKATSVFDEVIPLTLISDDFDDRGQSEQQRTATKANLCAVLFTLAGKSTEHCNAKGPIPNADRLERVTPEDLVIISIATHGYADVQGVFYLFPQDAGANISNGLAAVLPSAISSNDLSLWLRDVDAGEMVLIVDACHSAAAVQGDEFRPGPLGSRGLGQLSYDKGIRILAATQADNVALESAHLEHGLLTAALILDGLVKQQADVDPRDGTVTVQKWLKYAVKRVPQLYKEAQDGKRELIAHGSSGRLRGPRSKILETVPQTPVLFDFSRSRTDTILAKTN
jgi:WD40 repeat protein/uncharacterized caspase-like protein